MPDSVNPSVRVVIVTLDNHLAGAVERANMRMAKDNISIGLYAASDWDRDPSVLDRAKADIAKADIIIATMLFLEDHARAIHPALLKRRDDCDAIVGLMSSADIVKLTRLGAYSMDKPAKGPLALLKKLRGSKKPGASSGAGQMKMLRRLPKILRFVPGAAQDVRQYFLTMQYWLAGSDDNVVDMVRSLIDRYATGERSALVGQMAAEPPREYPEVGVYHPDMKERLTEDVSRLPKAKKTSGTVGLLMLRSYLLGRDTGHYDGMIETLEASGLRVIPAFANGLDARPAIDEYFVKIWTLVQGILAPIQFLVFLLSLSLVVRFLWTGEGESAAAISVLAKTLILYAIMITGSIWEKAVFNEWLFARPFFWEDVFSMAVLALHTAYILMLFNGWGTAQEQMYVALAAYATYVINAGQFLRKLRMARLGAGDNMTVAA